MKPDIQESALRCIVAAALFSVFSLLLPARLGAEPKGWKTYEDEALGFSLRYPSSMTFHTGEEAAFRGFFSGYMAPDVRVSMPVSFEETHYSEADVAIYTNQEDWCAEANVHPEEHQTLADRRFRRFTTGDGATGHTIHFVVFSTTYRQKCFTILSAVQSYRYDEPRSRKEKKRTEQLRRDIEAQLLKVIETLTLTDRPASKN